MKTMILATTALLAATAALAQTPQATAPAAPATPAPMAHPMHDKVMTRAEVVANVREHFTRLDSNKDGSITKEEAMEGRDHLVRRFEKGDGPHAMMMDAPGRDPNAAFDRLDANKDGSISRDEFTKAREERIERRIVMREERKDDAGGSPKDGKEMRKHVMRMHGGPGGFGTRMIVLADTDKDGKITLAEAEALALQHFDQMDSNKDGQVTPEERRAGRPMIRKWVEEKKSGS